MPNFSVGLFRIAVRPVLAMVRGTTLRAENFGRYDPITHTLFVDHNDRGPPGYPSNAVAIKVGNRGRLHAVLSNNDKELRERAARSGVPDHEPIDKTHPEMRRSVPRPEKFGRYDPISSTLTVKGGDGRETAVRVGDEGRLKCAHARAHTLI